MGARVLRVQASLLLAQLLSPQLSALNPSGPLLTSASIPQPTNSPAWVPLPFPKLQIVGASAPQIRDLCKSTPLTPKPRTIRVQAQAQAPQPSAHSHRSTKNSEPSSSAHPPISPSALSRRGLLTSLASFIWGLGAKGARAEEEMGPNRTGRRSAAVFPGYGFEEVIGMLDADLLIRDVGGVLFQESVFKTDVDYPSWMAGTWDVEAKIERVLDPVAKGFGVQDNPAVSKLPWSPLGPRFRPGEEDIGKVHRYQLKFVKTVGGSIKADPVFNYVSMMNAFNSQEMLQQEEVSSNWWRQVLHTKIDAGGRTRADSTLRKVRCFGTPLCSRCTKFASWEIYDADVRSEGGEVIADRSFEFIQSLDFKGRRVWLPLPHLEISNDDTVEGKQRIALFLVPGDEKYDKARRYATTLIDISTTLRRVPDSIAQ